MALCQPDCVNECVSVYACDQTVRDTLASCHCEIFLKDNWCKQTHLQTQKIRSIKALWLQPLTAFIPQNCKKTQIVDLGNNISGYEKNIALSVFSLAELCLDKFTFHLWCIMNSEAAVKYIISALLKWTLLYSRKWIFNPLQIYI